MRQYGIILVLLLSVGSCYKIESYPPEPGIEYVSFVLSDSVDILDNPVLAGVLQFSFVDGDGDVGDVEPSDENLIDSVKHVYLTLLKKENGVFVEQDLEVQYEYRIPYFNGGPNNPLIKGDVFVSELNFYPPFERDTLKFTFYMKDRAGNKSNIAETELFVPIDSLD